MTVYKVKASKTSPKTMSSSQMLKSKKVVLLSCVGTSPAVLTETVWAMATEKHIVPDQIVVLTTTAGRDKLIEKLLSGGAASVWNQMLAALRRKKIKTDGKLRFGCSQECIRLFSDPSGERDISDITTPEENMTAADFILQTIRSYSENPSCVIYASLAGGRKTMSALMLSCMSLLAREDDHVLHVLVNAPFEGGVVPDFFYPDGAAYYARLPNGEKGDKCSANPKIDLIDLPFVKVRGLYEERFKSRPPSYAELVRETQKNAPEAKVERPLIRLDFSSGCIYVNDDAVASLSPQEFMLLVVLLTEFPKSDNDLTESLMNYRSKTQKVGDLSSGVWLERFLYSDRFKTNDVSYEIEVMRKVRSSLRKKLEAVNSIKPYILEILSKNKCVVTYPKERISADVRELQSQFKRC